MSLSDDQKCIRCRNLLIALAIEVMKSRARAAKLKAAAAAEQQPGKRAGLRTLWHCTNRNTMMLEQMLSRNRAALLDYFASAKAEEIAKEKIILHKL